MVMRKRKRDIRRSITPILIAVMFLVPTMILLSAPAKAEFANTASLGYELLPDGIVIHLWNKDTNYYFDKRNGIHLSSDGLPPPPKKWTENILSFGYFENGETYNNWTELYRMDEATDYIETVTGVTDEYLNFTFQKYLTIGGYHYCLTLIYHLGVDDTSLSIISKAQNVWFWKQDRNHAFGWIISNITIDGQETENYIRFALLDGNTLRYNLHDITDERYTYLKNEFWLERGPFYVQMNWLETQPYLLTVKSSPEDYNSNVILYTVIGPLEVGEGSPGNEKSTLFLWKDAGSLPTPAEITTAIGQNYIPIILASAILFVIIGLSLTTGFSKESLITIMLIAIIGIITIKIILP